LKADQERSIRKLPRRYYPDRFWVSSHPTLAVAPVHSFDETPGERLQMGMREEIRQTRDSIKPYEISSHTPGPALGAIVGAAQQQRSRSRPAAERFRFSRNPSVLPASRGSRQMHGKARSDRPVRPSKVALGRDMQADWVETDDGRWPASAAPQALHAVYRAHACRVSPSECKSGQDRGATRQRSVSARRPLRRT